MVVGILKNVPKKACCKKCGALAKGTYFTLAEVTMRVPLDIVNLAQLTLRKFASMLDAMARARSVLPAGGARRQG